MKHSRSQFLTGALRFGAIGALAPKLLMDGRLAERVMASAAHDASKNILIVIQLGGGNDGLNTVIPYKDSNYQVLRPKIGVAPNMVLPLGTTPLGFHPNLSGLKALYDKGKVAVVDGVSYPSPNLSHFRSTDIWLSAQPVGVTDTGWLGRYLDAALPGNPNPLKAVNIGSSLSKAFWAKQTQVPAVQDFSSFVFRDTRQVLQAYQDIYSGSSNLPYLTLVQLANQTSYQASVEIQPARKIPQTLAYPSSSIGRSLKLVSQIIATNLGTRVFMVGQGGYDDHADEVQAHQQLMRDLGDAILFFYEDMVLQGRANQVLLMTFSEFGRRPGENASQGTDHGTTAPMLIVGGAVKGGVYGQTPDLRPSSLDGSGNLPFTPGTSVDFRSVYGTVVANWLGGDPAPVVLGTTTDFPIIPFV